jgi:poly-beta-1,6-N-acetyl-D-glucosamine synthase
MSIEYLVISPAKDEARYIEHTLIAMTQQTVKPTAWFIVDDGSVDSTPEIVSRYRDRHDFIRLIRRENSGTRKPGSAVINAFNYGFRLSNGIKYDLIVKLDCDLSFEPDYFERIIEKFAGDKRLGIASGIYYEKLNSGKWHKVNLPKYHAAGACKVIRKTCFQEIGGFVPEVGWDTVDEIRAISCGWKTTHFDEFQIKHHKKEGAGIGKTRTSEMHGEVYYLTGGGCLFLLFKILNRVFDRRYNTLSGIFGLPMGFIKAAVKRKKRLVTREEAKCYQNLLNRRLKDQAKGLLIRR